MNKPAFDMSRLIYLYEHRDFKGLVDFCNRLATKNMEETKTDSKETVTEETTVEAPAEEESEEETE